MCMGPVRVKYPADNAVLIWREFHWVVPQNRFTLDAICSGFWNRIISARHEFSLRYLDKLPASQDHLSNISKTISTEFLPIETAN